jgi:AbrB family looped-hinge helix DNA binding protein
MEPQVFDVRKLDKAGRVGLPEALRALLGWRSGDAIAIAVGGDGRVVLERRSGEREQSAPEDSASP